MPEPAEPASLRQPAQPAAAAPAPEPGPGGPGPSPWLLLVVPPLLWAGNFVLGRAMHAEISPASLTFWRWAVAALVLAPFALRDTWRARSLIADHWRLILCLALTGVVGFQFFVYQGLRTTTAINGVLIVATIPLAIPITAFLIDRARVTRRQAAGIALSLAGVVLVILRADLDLASGLELTVGDFWVFLAVPAWALYSVLIRRRPAALAPLPLLLATILAGLLVLAPGYAIDAAVAGGFAVTLPVVATILYVGVFASVVAFVCWNHGVAKVGAAKAGLFIHLMPVFAAMLAILFLGERLHGYHVAGAALVATGLLLSSTAPRS